MMSNNGIVGAWMLRPRRAKLIEEHSAAIRRLIEIDACAADRTASVRVDVTGIGDERELENLTVTR